MKKKLLWIFLLLLISAGGFAQGITVTGTVSDAKTKETLPGVNINVKGTNVRIATNKNGGYTLSDLKPDAVLVFSFMGYKPVEAPLNGRTKIDVSLSDDFANLNEVVVVGFGTKKKINIAGAIDQISGKQLESRPLANVIQGLQGLSPGLNITYPGGAPGTVPTINIRGYTSINGGSPLIVIDGIPATSNDDLLRLTPSDITSFTVLRDAASAAIYGARAAFGVILVTTKQGIAGHNTISYNTYTSWAKPTLLPKPVTDPYIFSRVLETSTDNTPWDYVNYSDEYYRWAKERSDNPSIADTRINPTDPTKWEYMGSNDWYKYFFNDASLSKSHTLTFSGGATVNNKPLTYYLSADYTKDNGLNKLTDDYWSRYGLRSKVGFSPVSWLKLDNNLNIYQTKRALPNSNITDLYYLMPTDVATNPDGTWANTAAGRLAAKLTDGGNSLQNMFGFQNITSATALFLNGDLQVNADASFKRELWKTHTDTKKYKIGYGPNDVREEGGTGSVSEGNGYLYNNAFNVYSTYKKTLGDHFFSAMVGFNSENYSYSTVNASKDVLISSSLPYLSLTSGTATASGDYSAYATNSVFSRLNYTFKNRYILEATGRYDGSSRFPVTKRWGFFPSASAAWIVSGENFFKPLAPTVSTFKLRSSYGDLGNQNVGDFGYIQSLATGTSGYLIGGAGQNQIVTGAPGLNVDPQTYTWERVSTRNFGTDIGLLNDKLSLTFDYYIRDTKGMLTAGQELPAVLGTGVPRQNAADLRTKGWEFSISYRDRFELGSKPFNFDAKIFIADSRSKITKFKNDQGLFSSYRVGQDIGEIWGLENDGLFRSKDEIAKLDESAIVPWGALSIVEGWPKYKDLDGNGKIETGLSAKNPKDLKVIGNSTDRYTVGANINMDWRGIDLAIFLQGVLKRDFYPHHYLFWGPFQQPYANVYPWNLNYYRGTADSPEQRAKHSASYIAAGLADANTNSEYPVLQSWLADANYGSGLDIPQTKYLLNGAYLRIKNVSVGYTIPAKWTKKIGISRLRFYATGENLYEFSAIKKYIDPEAVNQGPSAWAYPYQRRYALGLNLDF
ncbi:TonB-linked outer membrane protein, SusC/RagA family [Mucilaginibacter gossypiicola]|uniref:TonB-linked outer membrane protein, SusC/RagA family n=1 Tax=Mucilaginibacter gossypiicola TaxID=551995 RepID=A0A1H8NQH5_9SPHI|nr:TonB-dependent receptor [Mucilaginibacter gossypiicola]SEO31884.1 TonB-linked outer membrane protein, SusC/RagA family [Mucilaginibacter gossypiicola]